MCWLPAEVLSNPKIQTFMLFKNLKFRGSAEIQKLLCSLTVFDQNQVKCLLNSFTLSSLLAVKANRVQSGFQTPMNPVNSLITSLYSHMHLM